jgi:hypothetical protein
MPSAITFLAVPLGALAIAALMPTAVPHALAAPALVAAASGLPRIDIQKSCRESSDALYGSTTASAYDTCVEDEKAAGDKLAKDWSTYPAADKAQCVHAAAYLPSYVEWLTCIEGESTLRKIRKDNAGAPPG